MTERLALLMREETDALLRREVRDPTANIEVAMEILHRLVDLAEHFSARSFASS